MFERMNWRVKEVINKMFFGKTGSHDIYRALNFGSVPEADDKMRSETEKWDFMFRGLSDAGGYCKSLNLPGAIAAEIARLVTVELESSISGNEKADILNGIYTDFLKNIRTHTEYACALGGVIFKPYIENGQIAIDCVHPAQFVPVEFNGQGKICGAVFVEQIKKDKKIYTRLEYQHLKNDGYHVVNKAYCSGNENYLGYAVSLDCLDCWAGLSEELVILNSDGSTLEKPLFAYFKMPFANHIDPACPLGVSVFARGADLIKEADLQYGRILWEYEGSELAIDASIGALKPYEINTGQSGDSASVRFKLPKGKQRLFRELGIDKGDGGDLYNVFSPEIRHEALFRGLNELLKRIEFACYLSFGTISDPQAVEKTAEEIKMSKQRSYSAVCEIQKSLQASLEDLVWAMNIYASLYGISDIGGEVNVGFAWGDAVSADIEKERELMRRDCIDGAAAWWEYRVRFYGESEEDAKAFIESISAEMGKQDIAD